MRELILVEILAVPAERSRGRHNPRVVKRKMSSFPTKARAAPRRRPAGCSATRTTSASSPRPVRRRVKR